MSPSSSSTAPRTTSSPPGIRRWSTPMRIRRRNCGSSRGQSITTWPKSAERNTTGGYWNSSSGTWGTLQRKPVTELEEDGVVVRERECVGPAASEPGPVIPRVAAPFLGPHEEERTPGKVFPAEKDVRVQDRLVEVRVAEGGGRWVVVRDRPVPVKPAETLVDSARDENLGVELQRQGARERDGSAQPAIQLVDVPLREHTERSRLHGGVHDVPPRKHPRLLAPRPQPVYRRCQFHPRHGSNRQRQR